MALMRLKRAESALFLNPERHPMFPQITTINKLQAAEWKSEATSGIKHSELTLASKELSCLSALFDTSSR